MTTWYHNATLVRGLGEALANADIFQESADFANFMRKPQQFDDMYSVWQDANYPTSEDDDGWEDFIANLDETQESESDET